MRTLQIGHLKKRNTSHKIGEEMSCRGDHKTVDSLHCLQTY